MRTSNEPCYCCTGKPFADCCEPLLTGKRKAESPEVLMRSRYSAFCTHNSEYIRTTHHPNYQTEDDGDPLDQALKTTQWLGLKIIETQGDTVEFCAFYRDLTDSGVLSAESSKAAPTAQQLHEQSHFVCENDEWFYTEGTMLPTLKLGRNDICYCGSQRKYKQCCGAN